MSKYNWLQESKLSCLYMCDTNTTTQITLSGIHSLIKTMLCRWGLSKIRSPDQLVEPALLLGCSPCAADWGQATTAI